MNPAVRQCRLHDERFRIGADANLDGRVGKLKEMRAVQQQVFPNGAGKFLEPEINPRPRKSRHPRRPQLPTCSSASMRLKTQLATLTGQFEQHDNAMRQMEARVKRLKLELKAQADQAAAGTALGRARRHHACGNSCCRGLIKPKPATILRLTPTAKPTAARTAAVAAIEKPATGGDRRCGYTYGFRLPWEAKFYRRAQVTLEETIKKSPAQAPGLCPQSAGPHMA